MGTGDAADIIAHVGIANRFPVDTAADHTAADAGNTADVGNRVDRFRIGNVLQGNIGQLHGVLLGCGVHRGQIGTIPDNTAVSACDTAHKMSSVDLTLSGTGFDQACDAVAAGNTAHIITAGKISGEAAAQNLALIASCNAADFLPTAAGMDFTVDRQIADNRGFGQSAEKAFHGTIGRDTDSRHPMTVARKGTAKNGNADKGRVAEIQVFFQAHIQILAIGVQTAILGECQKFLLA